MRILELRDKITFRASGYARVHFQELTNGFIVRWDSHAEDPVIVNMPAAAMWTDREIRFFPVGCPLNEFGILYIGLYILGNYARYYPDYWMSDVESGSPLALAAEEFMSMAEVRMALLTLSELSRRYLVVRA
jgi:hypothetical protein